MPIVKFPRKRYTGSSVERTIINMSDYGITISTTDNKSSTDTGLATIKAAISGFDKPAYKIEAPTGIGKLWWGETSLPWLSEVKDFIFDGNGCTIQPIADYWWRGEAFRFASFYQKALEGPFIPGIRFKTVASGQTKIYLWTESEVSNFYVGQRILLTGRELQGYGYPPNLSAYEWKVVSSTGTDGTGTYVQVTTPLSYFYNDNWQDRLNFSGTTDLNVGKPRVILLDALAEDYHYTKYAKFQNFSLAYNPLDTIEGSYTPHSSVIFWEGEEVEFENIVLNEYAPLWPTHNKICRVKNCTVPYGIEIDKVTGIVTIDGGTSGGISGATGTERLIVKNHTNPYCNTSAKREEWRNVTFSHATDTTGLYPQPEGMCTFDLTLENLTANLPSAYDAIIEKCIATILHVGTDDTEDVTTDGTYFYIPDTEFTQYLNKAMIPGLLLWREDGTKFCRVADVELTGAAWKISTDGAAGTLNNGNWCFSRTEYIIDLGGHSVSVWGVPMLGGNDVRWKGNTIENSQGERTTIWDQNDFRFKSGGGFRTIKMCGLITGITATVTTAYSGSYCDINFYKHDSSYEESNRFFNLDLKYTGTRTYTTSGATGLQSFETYTASKMTSYVDTLSYNPNIETQGSTLPEFTIAVTWKPYENS